MFQQTFSFVVYIYLFWDKRDFIHSFIQSILKFEYLSAWNHCWFYDKSWFFTHVCWSQLVPELFTAGSWWLQLVLCWFLVVPAGSWWFQLGPCFSQYGLVYYTQLMFHWEQFSKFWHANKPHDSQWVIFGRIIENTSTQCWMTLLSPS